MKLQKLEKEHAVYLGVGAAVFVLIIVLLVIVALNRAPQESTVDGAAVTEEEEYGQSLLINNYYQLGQALGYNGASAVRQQLEKIVFDETELTYATKPATSFDGYVNHYESTLIESSFNQYSFDPEVYTFLLEISDGRVYEVYARAIYDCVEDEFGKEACYATVAIRDGTVLFETTTTNPDVLEMLEEWKNEF